MTKFAIVTILLFAFSYGVLGQDKNLIILTGTLYDQNGAVIPGAKVTASNKSGERFDAVSNAEGVYQLKLKFVPIGSNKLSAATAYRIECDLRNRGFAKVVVNDFKVVATDKGKMYLDMVFDALDPEPCGYSGADCLQ